jgi:hypothetical protein
VSTINSVISLALSLFPPRILFTPNGLSQGSEILHGVSRHNKIRIGVKTNLGDPPPDPIFVVVVLVKNKKCLELAEIRKLEFL